MNSKYFLFAFSLSLASLANAQNKTLPKRDSLPTKKEDSDEKNADKRNVLLNANSNTGPRDVNVGLPTSVGGMTIYENDLPVTYYFWPELPNRSWRSGSGVTDVSLMKLSEAAVLTGDFGFLVNSKSKLGDEKTHVQGSLAANNFGWLKGDLTMTGALGKNWFYTAGIYANYDPQGYDMGFSKYSERTRIYRGGLTKKFNNNRGEISFLYKYSNSASLTNYAVFDYQASGKVKALDNFRIGRDSYFLNSGIYHTKDALSGQDVTIDLKGNDISTRTHTLDIVGNYKLNNGWDFRFDTRFHHAQSSLFYSAPLGVSTVTAADGYSYFNNGNTYTGLINSMLTMYTPNIPTNTLYGRFELVKSVGNHNWKIGLTEYNYHIHKYISDRSFFYQTVSAQPELLARNTPGGTSNTDQYGYYNYNVGSEYHNGTENKVAAYLYDSWDISKKFNLKYGINLRNQTIKGDYYLTPRTSAGVILDTATTTKINNSYYQIGGSLSAVYKLTKYFGFIADAIYTENNGQLESYSSYVVPNMAKIKSKFADFGIYYNSKLFSLVSQVSYLSRNKYLQRLNLINPDNSSQSYSQTAYYNIQTMGWTTDIVANPFKGFSFHYLITLQNPLYKNYSFTAFGNNYSYNNNNVIGVSKTLMEIDPSYTTGAFKIWTSFRYFSKQYANLTNVLFFAPHWETFGGVNYTISKHLTAGITVVNFLNQKGAQGTVNGAELVTDASKYYNTVLSGTYILPTNYQASLSFDF